MRFASFLSGGFITASVANPPESKLAKCNSVQCCDWLKYVVKMRTTERQIEVFGFKLIIYIGWIIDNQ